MTPFRSDAEFITSLKPAQRDYWLSRVAEMQRQLQDALRDIARGLSTVSQLHQDATALETQLRAAATRRHGT